ncbi:mitochondrial carrier domain-containing protein [Pelagophyceae sp. CCMP2097]|nr:mitochondrial carrier domain-containing protein [Pelagophyceae sp. CCMP2097]|mmetsp:Transcript_6934/g.22492  ORF Transcript_6934/g.22492 Transcript_6934/m.22492 type:complete len:288 (+) Transcript_6934:64-927(+)
MPLDDVSVRFVASAASASIAETLTLPIDITKLRLQTYTGGSTTQFAVARSIVVNEGFGALWKGIAPALLRQSSYTGLCLVLYEPMRDCIAGGASPEDLPFYKRVMAGGAAGAVSIFAMNPTDVLKARMQNSRVDLSMRTTVKEIWAHSGVRGFWAGAAPNVARCFVGNACELGCYDQFKFMLCETKSPYARFAPDSTLTHLGASTGAGFVSAIFSTPVDVLKTRLQSSAGLTNDTLFSLMVDIPRKEGFGTFYKGFWPLFQRKVVWTVIFYVSYEKMRAGIKEAAGH